MRAPIVLSLLLVTADGTPVGDLKAGKGRIEISIEPASAIVPEPVRLASLEKLRVSLSLLRVALLFCKA